MRRPAQATARAARFMPPTGGMNTVVPLGDLPPTDCIYAYNLMAGEYGLRSRIGSREWCTGLVGIADNTVRTIMPFTGSTSAQNKLFAVTSKGIYDVSASSAAPTLVLTFGTQTGDTGYGSYCVAVTSAGHFLLYCDEVNGYHVYTESTGLWAVITTGGGGTQISGVTAGNLVFVMQWKGRVWFIERDTFKAWYSAAGAIYGALSSFNLAQRLDSGGYLVALASLTYDGGAGMDDSLVAVSSGGDVVIYQGTDPSAAATFGIKGAWSLGGAPPAGRRQFTDYGGDLLVQGPTGIIPMSKLTMGGAAFSTQYETAKIANLWNYNVLTQRSLKGWSLRIHPQENALIATIPVADGQNTVQLAMSLSTKGWFHFRDLPMLSGDSWDGTFYFGTADGRVMKSSDYFDGVTLADANAYTPVTFAALTGFSHLNSPTQKLGGLLRPSFLSEGATPAFEVQGRWDYDISEIASVSGTPTGTGALWDVALWDSALWGGSAQASSAARGFSGIGVNLALAFRGKAIARTTFAGCDVTYQGGGWL